MMAVNAGSMIEDAILNMRDKEGLEPGRIYLIPIGDVEQGILAGFYCV